MSLRATYLDSSAIVKLAVKEPESMALRRWLRRRRPYVASALAVAEVGRALLPFGSPAVRRGDEALTLMDLVRISPSVLRAAAALEPADLRTLDAVHLATALLLGTDLGRVVTYDERMAEAARSLGMEVSSPR